MLASLSIRDVVLIDRLDLDFPRGLCALTGETGAGKSILLDALGLSLGSRAEGRLVRHGATQAVVTALFNLSARHPAHALLAEHGLDPGTDGLMLRRTLGADGRSRAFVNDQPVNIALLRRLGETLVEIHGQFESQRLLDPAQHRGLLDGFGDCAALVEDCAGTWRMWRRAVDLRLEAQAQLAAARDEEAFLRHGLDELTKADPRPGEEEELALRRIFLQNAEKLLNALAEAARELDGGSRAGGVEDSLRSALRQVERIADKAQHRLDPVIQSLERALGEASEARAQLERIMHDADLEPGRLDEIEERLFALRALARKYGTPVDDLGRLAVEFGERLAALDDGAGRIGRLEKEETLARSRFHEAAIRLGQVRRDAAARLDQEVAAELEPLRLGKARFVTRIDPLAEADWDSRGGERIDFQVATNPGMPPGPLARIASGGELSRFMLALKVVLAQADAVPTLVFDEVDAGVGGAVAAAVGERLSRLAADVQVLVVTHSPQVAARGDHHWRIAKSVGGGTTRTSVDVLDPAGRREEIARMLAGAAITDEARAAADSLLLRAGG